MANKMANDFATRASTASTPDPLRHYTLTLGIAASYSGCLYENALPLPRSAEPQNLAPLQPSQPYQKPPRITRRLGRRGRVRVRAGTIPRIPSGRHHCGGSCARDTQ